MGRVASALVWGIVCAIVLGGGGFGYLLLTSPKGDPSVFGAAVMGGVAMAAAGLIGGLLYGGFKGSAK